MPIKVAHNLPAVKVLQQENIFTIDEKRAESQDIRPLKIIILNIMPTKETTETQLLRMLSNTPLQVDITLMHTKSHVSKNTSSEHLQTFYKTFNDVKNEKFDAMIITGAPVENIEFHDVDYWDELEEIMEWSKSNVFSTLHICWASQAGLYYHYGIPKYKLPKKVFGVFQQNVLVKYSPLYQGFDSMFYMPHSRHTEVRKEDIEKVKDLTLLVESEQSGVSVVMAKNYRQIFVSGHMEYDDETLAKEYERDINKGMKMDVPEHYYKNNNPEEGIVSCWHGSANLFFANWLNYCVYQETPYDLNQLETI